MVLNWRGASNVPRLPQLGQVRSARPLAGSAPSCFSAYASIRWSARNRLWQDWHSVSGSVKLLTWPLACHTSGARMTEESRPTMSSRSCTMNRHHWRLMLFFSSTPSGP